MIRKIDNVYLYSSYCILLTDDFLLRSESNPKFSLRAYAQHLEIAPGFLSDVMRGKKSLSRTKGREVFTHLGLNSEELDYVENMIAYQNSKGSRSQTEAVKEFRAKLFNWIESEKGPEDLLLKSADHFMLHGLVSAQTRRSEIFRLMSLAGVGGDRVQSVLDEMTSAGYFTLDEGNYSIVNGNVNVARSENLLPTQRQLVERMHALITSSGDMKEPEAISNYYAIGLDDETRPIAYDAYKQFIRTMARLSNQTPTAKYIAFLSVSLATAQVETYEAHAQQIPNQASCQNNLESR